MSAPAPFSAEYASIQPGRKVSLHERFWSNVDIGEPDDCWPWTACVTAIGYGRVGIKGLLPGPETWVAHRVAWVLTRGPIPDDLTVDHLCHSMATPLECPGGAVCLHRRCVNPAHLEAVTKRENDQRREARKPYFACGHAKEGNVQMGGGKRMCRKCNVARVRAWRESRAGGRYREQVAG